MLNSLLYMVVDAVLSFFTLSLVARQFMQWSRAPFRNPLGQFIFATSDWAVLPLRRKLGAGIGKLDIACLLPAWLLQTLLVSLQMLLRGGFADNGNLGGMMAGMWGAGLVELLRMGFHVLTGAVLLSAILSWVNPYSPVAPVVNALVQPYLRPIQRVIPLVGGVDLSPMVLLLAIQVILTLLSFAKGVLFALVVL